MAVGNPLPSPNFLLQVADVLPAAAPLGSPFGVTALPVGTGGTFTAGQKFIKVTATNASGESVASQEVSATVVLNGSIIVNWQPVAGATGYRVYFGTAVDGEAAYFVAAGASTSTLTLTGAAGTGGTVPAPTWNTVSLINSWDADYNESVSEYDVFALADPIQVDGRAKVKMSFGGYLPDSTDSGTAVINAHEVAKDTVLARVLWDGTNGFYCRCRVDTKKAMAKAGANLIEVQYTFTVLPSSLTQIGTGPLL